MSADTPEIIPETEALAPSPDTVEDETPETEAATEETPEAEEESQETNEEVVEEEAPKRLSSNQRLRRQNQRLQNRLIQAEEELEKLSKPQKVIEDPNADWATNLVDATATKAVNGVKQAFLEKERDAIREELAETKQDMYANFNKRAEQFKNTKAKDFDDVVKDFVVNKKGEFSETVKNAVMNRDMGPELTYFLAKNPNLAEKINSLTPIDQAVELGLIEAQLKSPARKTTKTQAPLTTVKGGSSGNFDPATASMDEYVARRKAGWSG